MYTEIGNKTHLSCEVKCVEDEQNCTKRFDLDFKYI